MHLEQRWRRVLYMVYLRCVWPTAASDNNRRHTLVGDANDSTRELQ